MRVTRVGDPALRPAQCPAPAGDAGRDARRCIASGSRPRRATTTRRPCPGWSRASRLRRRLCPGAGRPGADAAPLLRRGVRRCRCAGAADLPGGDAAASPRPTPAAIARFMARRQPPGHAGRPVQLSRACRRSACPWASTLSGMPMGLQLVGRPFAEALLLRVAHAYEEVAGRLAPAAARPSLGVGAPGRGRAA